MHVADPGEFDALLPYMPDVGQCARSLVELDATWRMIEAFARLQCSAEAALILPPMGAARSGFNALEQDLVKSLVAEKLATAIAELSTKAQYVIDIIVRNLYERTADVGFLATDATLCAFVAGIAGDPGALRQRLQDYRSKYTVYDDIVLLDVEGRVLLCLDHDAQGDSAARLAAHDGQVAMLGCCAAQGYREFKASDGYRDDVLAVVLRCHGPLRRTAVNMTLAAPATGLAAATDADACKYATFTVGGQLHAIAADEVRVAYPASVVAPVSAGAMPEHCGMLALRDDRDITGYIWVADLARMLGMAAAAGEGAQVIVLRHGEHGLGILVDTLDTVAAFADEDIIPAPFAWGGNDMLVQRVIRSGGQLVPVVDADRLRRMLDTGQPMQQVFTPDEF